MTSPIPGSDDKTDALLDLAHLFGDGMTADHVGPRMTCREAEGLAAAIYLVNPAAAESFLRGHARCDEDSTDIHAVCSTCGLTLEVIEKDDDSLEYLTWQPDHKGTPTCTVGGGTHVPADAEDPED